MELVVLHSAVWRGGWATRAGAAVQQQQDLAAGNLIVLEDVKVLRWINMDGGRVSPIFHDMFMS
jgi:hypothetical protein